ncbi:MAG: TonB family protein [Rhizobiales bacterium]|nr:TonB family protein [Hyphomicrobiales bacterium]
MSAVEYTNPPPSNGRVFGFIFVVLLHALLLWGLMNGLAQTVVEVVTGPLEVQIIRSVEQPPVEPTPPPPEIVPVKKAFIPPPEVKIAKPAEAPPPKAIQAVQTEKKAPPPPPQMAQPDPSAGNRKPSYPSASRRMQEEGTVMLMLLVGPDGAVSEAKVAKSSGYDRLDEAAVKTALRYWRFKPLMRNGQAIASWFKFAVTFRLND